MSGWAIDLGTTNTGVACWDTETRQPRLVELREVCGNPDGDALLEAPRMVPSCTQLLPADAWSRLGRMPLVRRNFFVGADAIIGRPAMKRNEAWPGPSFAPTFKSQLSRDPLRPLARVGQVAVSAREVARAYFRELLRQVHATTGVRIRDLALTVPVAAYDGYRAELRAMADDVGVHNLRFVDEPVAAAIGYGLGIDRSRRVLVFDMGGGTMHAALVHLTARGVEAGNCEVLGKEGRAVGGNVVDQWLLEDFCAEMGLPATGESADETFVLWQRLVLAEARRVKEAVHFREHETFTVAAPDELRGLRARLDGRPTSLHVTRERVVDVLRRRGLYNLVEEALVAASTDGVEEVLLVGGSTLLPGIYPLFEKRFGRDRVRAWQPFESVVLGAAAYSAGAFAQSDLIVHDYAVLTHDAKTQAPQHTIIVPRGTRFPTGPDFWRRQLVPTCSLGEPETLFKLLVFEIGRNGDDVRRFGWDASGNLHPLGGPGNVDVAVPLNASNPALGYLDPPQPPSDRRPRLDVSFGVDADRWLTATVRDLQTKKLLMKEQAVARLL